MVYIWEVGESEMKLLYCPTCNSVFNLISGKWKMCDCGRARGRYMDNSRAVYSGGVPIGFNNFTFFPALSEQPEKGLGRRFEAFVIPKECPSMQRIDSEEDGVNDG